MAKEIKPIDHSSFLRKINVGANNDDLTPILSNDVEVMEESPIDLEKKEDSLSNKELKYFDKFTRKTDSNNVFSKRHVLISNETFAKIEYLCTIMNMAISSKLSLNSFVENVITDHLDSNRTLLKEIEKKTMKPKNVFL